MSYKVYLEYNDGHNSPIIYGPFKGYSEAAKSIRFDNYEEIKEILEEVGCYDDCGDRWDVRTDEGLRLQAKELLLLADKEPV